MGTVKVPSYSYKGPGGKTVKVKAFSYKSKRAKGLTKNRPKPTMQQKKHRAVMAKARRRRKHM